MQFNKVSLPEIYKESSDFRFFCKWFELSLQRIKYDTENMLDLYDPLRCPKDLLWMLADTIGFKYDDRLPTSFNRLVLLYFMSMIRHKGSKDGVTLAAEVNLAQFKIDMLAGTGYTEDSGDKVLPNPILYNRLEDTSIPVNSVYVTPHTSEGYIDIVYFSTKKPIDACIEYVRPVGMYVFQHAGVRYDARTKISVDARLTNLEDMNVSIGSTHVGHYSRDDYARMQHMKDESRYKVDIKDNRDEVYYRNKDSEGEPDTRINPGYRALYSLQLCNNEHIVKSLIDPIFSLGYGPQEVGVLYQDNYLKYPYQDRYHNRSNITDRSKAINLRYDRELEESISSDVYTVDDNRTSDILNPRPAVNPVMSMMGDAIAVSNASTNNEVDTEVDESGDIATDKVDT